MNHVSSTSTLQTLMALYENENKASGGSASLTKDQVGTIEDMLKGGASASTASTDPLTSLLGQSTTSSTDLGTILDQIEAKHASTSTTSTTSDTSATPQQKAVSLMQNIYRSQQTACSL